MSPIHEYLLSQEEKVLDSMVIHLCRISNCIVDDATRQEETKEVMKNAIIQICSTVQEDLEYDPYVSDWLYKLVKKAANVVALKEQYPPSLGNVQLSTDSKNAVQTSSSKSFSLLDLLNDQKFAENRAQDSSLILQILDDFLQKEEFDVANNNSQLDKRVIEHLQVNDLGILNKLESISKDQYVHFICGHTQMFLTQRKVFVKLLVHGLWSQLVPLQNNQSDFLRWLEIYWTVFNALSNELETPFFESPHNVKEVCFMMIGELINVIRDHFRSYGWTETNTYFSKSLAWLLNIVFRNFIQYKFDCNFDVIKVEELIVSMCTLVWPFTSKIDCLEIEIYLSHYMAIIDPFASWFTMCANSIRACKIVSIMDNTFVPERLYLSFLYVQHNKKYLQDRKISHADVDSYLEADLLHSLFVLHSILICSIGHDFPFRRLGDFVKNILKLDLFQGKNRNITFTLEQALFEMENISNEQKEYNMYVLHTILPVIYIIQGNNKMCSDLDADLKNCLVNIVTLMVMRSKSTTAVAGIFILVIELMYEENEEINQDLLLFIVYKAMCKLIMETENGNDIVQTSLSIIIHKLRVESQSDLPDDTRYCKLVSVLSFVNPLIAESMKEQVSLDFERAVTFAYSLSNKCYANPDRALSYIASSFDLSTNKIKSFARAMNTDYLP